MTESKKQELLPCPFCGNKYVELDDSTEDRDEETLYSVVCDQCGSCGAQEYKRRDAIERWNDRAENLNGWTQDTPTEEGWYRMWSKGYQPTVMRLVFTSDSDLIDSDTGGSVNNACYADTYWSKIDMSLPETL